MLIDIILVLFVIAVAYIGKHRGLIRTLLGFLSSIVAAVISFFITPYVVDMLKPTPLYENLVGSIAGKISVDKISESPALPDAVADTVKGAGDKAADVLAGHLASVIIGIALFFIIIVILKVLLSLLSNVRKLPVVKQADSAGGFLFGLLFSLVIVYVGFAVWGCITAFQTPDILEETQLAKSMFENNLLMIFFVHS